MATATIDPNGVYVAMEAHVSPAGAANEGEELRGSDPRVQFAPHLFIEAGTPRNEWTHGPFHTVSKAIDENSAAVTEAREAAYARTAAANKVKFEQPKFVRLKKQLVTEVDGVPTTIERGSMLPADHPVVLAHGDLFA